MRGNQKYQKDDVALSFETEAGAPHYRSSRTAGIPQRSMMGGPGGSNNLQFMNFDLGSTSNSVPPPRVSYGGGGAGGFGAFEDEPPLLEELGINVPQIIRKTLTVLNPLRINPDLHEDADLSGPFMFCMLFGLCQLLAGKFHFGIILGWTSLASLFLYVVFNLLAGRNGSLELYRAFSLVGYCLLPMVIFSALFLFVPHGRIITFIMSSLAVVWSTRACTSLLVVLFPTADEHRSLVAYPCGLIYIAFSLLVVF
ncbi:protein YIPF5/7 [Marchantia polymorpha subsp. ruderalis]|uniref:Protein YIP n=3 Tax=Marchantia polymorpha TaxID=3197 RepID=A0AAF6B6H2_MARPO|nr:hypothetical protein MARPO_0150s0018 [Marchantia polymorpha]BBN07604.1 hypothetical protein Mp_4g04940 [Marchantia polymorpha subsp. ruderalis]PTQ28997.1 hypothetical protein MARPO_0150s0018 [Marchantia polymorpha]PTQ28998.1 hypothetical protein MARPO_0150s0018 [Marchantia polymorpha]BBN07605.1 hypothetical protein Mp_4g04940 [Marchantia polymorpha subsp. ruderalis]|eukprot:PTQ28996.1 hypothetical protein MARPO_0150s0018 [Marchantia polymorpha]